MTSTSLFFLMASQGNQLLASMHFLLLEQFASLCSDEWSILKMSYVLYKEIESTKSYQLVECRSTNLCACHLNWSVTIQISVQPVNICKLVLPRSNGGRVVLHLSCVEGLLRLRNQCMSLTTRGWSRLWLYVFYFRKSCWCIFMLLEQLASLSDDWSMLQKSSFFV